VQQLNFDIFLNPSVQEADELMLSRQVKEMYRLFVEAKKAGLTVPNTELAKIGFMYSARLYEQRLALIPYELCIDLVRKTENGVNYYSLVLLEQSQFYAQHKDKL